MTLEQSRARLAHRDVTGIANTYDNAMPMRKVYATVVHELTTLIRSAGAVQALEFVAAYSNDDKNKMGTVLLDQLGNQLSRVTPSITNRISLRARARETDDLCEYMHLSRELLSTLVWYRRCIQSILKIDPTQEASQGDDN
jgi:CRISPR/Cas system CMR-associated protein Cmr5 small subunit